MNNPHSSPDESLRARKKRLTHQRICQAAADLFVAQGFNSTTVDAIALTAEVSKPTFFNYFPSKLAVLHSLIDEMDTQFVQYITDELENNTSTEQRLKHLMVRSGGYISKSPDLTHLLLVEGIGAIGEPDKARARFNNLHNAMGILITEGIKQGEVRSDFPVEIQVQVLVGSYLYALLNWLSTQDSNLTDTLENIADFLMESLSP